MDPWTSEKGVALMIANDGVVVKKKGNFMGKKSRRDKEGILLRRNQVRKAWMCFGRKCVGGGLCKGSRDEEEYEISAW